MMHRPSRRAGLLLGTLALLACAPPRPREPLGTVTTHPRALDRYARLLARELADSSTVTVHQEMACEQSRLFDALGGEEMLIRTLQVEDSIYSTPTLRSRRDAIRNRLAGHSFEASGAVCDSLRKIADREDPIAPVDSTIRNR
jgi:hypothetical protein